MPTVTYKDTSYKCTTAFKGEDCIHLLDANGLMIVAFDGVTDFSAFKISDGTWTLPSRTNCYVAFINADGTISKGDRLFSPIIVVSGSVSLSPDHLGKTINFTDTTQSVDHAFTITKANSEGLPIGFEVAILFAMGKSTNIIFSGGVGVGISGHGWFTNPTITIPDKYTMVAIKKINSSNNWFVTGIVEVAS